MHHDLEFAAGRDPHRLGEGLAVLGMEIAVRICHRHIPFLRQRGGRHQRGQ